MSEELFNLQQEVFRQFGSSPTFGQSSLSADQQTLTFRWHGKPPAAFADLVSDRRQKFGLSVKVQPLAVNPAELKAEASRLLSVAGPGRGPVAAVAPLVDGDGLKVFVDIASAPGSRSQASSHVPADVLARWGVTSRFPLIGSTDTTIVPTSGSSRYFDRAPHWSGSRITSAQLTCSSSWAVGKVDGSRGMLTASHCGSRGDSWWAYNRYGDAAYSFGSTTQELDSRDAAVMTGSSYDNIFWSGKNTEAVASRVSAYVTGVSQGQHVCFSGGASGFNCGSYVVEPALTYRLTSVPGDIVGFATQRLSEPATSPLATNLPAAGNGDSGGPNLVLYQCGSGAVCGAALGIISAMDLRYDLGYSEGEPASATRHCSSYMISTLAYTAAKQMGWDLLGYLG